MIRRSFLLMLTVIAVADLPAPEGQIAAAEPSETRPTSHWIWGPTSLANDHSITFVKPFSIPNRATFTTLRVASQSAALQISLDGRSVIAIEPYDPLMTIDLADRLGPGDHRITVAARPVAGPVAFFLLLEIDDRSGRSQSIVSDDSWTVDTPAGPRAAVARAAVDARLLVERSHRVGITAVDNYEQWKQALGSGEAAFPASFQVYPGFEIQLIRAATDEEGSWVSLVTDPQGRLLIAKEERGLLRMTLSADGDFVAKTELIEDTLQECRGLAFVGDDLFVNANNSKGMYRLRAVAGQQFAAPELVLASSGGVGHGRNDLTLGPDGMIYSIHGDAVDIPTDAIDYTSPLRQARRGIQTREGHLLRIDPDAHTVEVLAAGLRNPFGIDFNSRGDLFTYDADAEYDMGAPWYRPTRVSELLIGGDYGWRGVTKSWPPYNPDRADRTPHGLDIGKGSPTAVKFGTTSNFPQRFREALFILDWAYGRILAVHCLPRGSSYLMSAETFLKGRPLNVTDIDFGSDGSMYLITGGRKTRSALYRVRYLADDAAETMSPKWTAQHEFAQHSRSVRRKLELLLQEPEAPDRLNQAWPHLTDPDPWIGQAAIHLIEQVPVSKWSQRALTETDLSAALRSLLSLARTSEQDQFPAILDRLNELLPSTDSRSLKQIALQTYSTCLTPESIQHDDARIATTQQRLLACFPDQSDLVNRQLSELLVRLKTADIVAEMIRQLRETNDPAEQMHYLYILRNVREGWEPADRRTFFSILAQSNSWVGGAGMSDFISQIRSAAVDTLNPDQRRELVTLLNDTDPEGNSSTKSKAPIAIQPRRHVREWTVDEIMSTPAKSMRRDLQRGEQLFAAVSCDQCHRLAGRGTPFGPDLTSASQRFGRRDLLTAIVEPSAVIPENYRSLQIITSDGNSYVGQVIPGGDYRSPVLRLATDPKSPQTIVEIEKAMIDGQRPSPVSWMPTGLLNTLSHDEILDLINYIESAGQ